MMLKTNASHVHYFYKIIISFLLIIPSLLFAGCSNQAQNEPVIQVTPTISLVPTQADENALVSDDASKSNPAASSNEYLDSWPISEIQARSLILERIDITKYTTELINDSLTINETSYYNFLVSENHVTYPPSLIVDKKTGEVFCYSEDGSISPFSEFPLYIPDDDLICDWNGKFIRYDTTGTVTALIELAQGDAHSFAFSLSSTVGFDAQTLYGVAELNGNTAVYALSDTASLYFVLSKEALSLSYAKTSSKDSEGNITAAYDGIYYLDGSAPPSVSLLSEEEAIDLLSALSKAETTLPEEISQYSLTSDNLTLTIKGYLCYSISAYTNLSGRKMLMNTYYVALDGSKIFMFDSSTADDIVIFSAS